MKDRVLTVQWGNSKKVLFAICVIVFAVCIALPFAAYAEDPTPKLIVKDGSDNTTFVVEDTGQVGVGTDAPFSTAKLHVMDGRARLRIESSTNSQNAAILMGSKGSAGTLGIGGLFYMGDEVGSILTNYHDRTSVIDNPLKSGQVDDYIFANSSAIPPLGTSVEILIIPVKKNERTFNK